MKTTKVMLSLLALIAMSIQVHAQMKIEFNKDLEAYTRSLVTELDRIPDTRKEQLNEIGDFLVSKLQKEEVYNALFVCTHNSRRSHLSDTWFKYALMFYGVDNLKSYSGGLEATGFHPNTIAALDRAGFTTSYNSSVDNPVVSISPAKFPVWRMQSKVYSHEVNPKNMFAAVMVCSDADQSCPLVPGAEGRFALPYQDPRYYDNTPAQDLKYDQSTREIAREMFYLADYIKKELILKIEVTKR